MFFKKKEIPTIEIPTIEIPTIREFVMSELEICEVCSDEEIMNKFGKCYMRKYSYSSIGKKCESIRKYLYFMTKEGTLREVTRNIRKEGSHEIFYSINS